MVTGASNDTPMAGWLESAWLERYLCQELTDEETEWFEAYMLDKPHLIEDIEADSDLRDGLMLSGEQAQVIPGNTVSHQSDRQGRLQWQTPAWAASVLMALVLGWFMSTDNPQTTLVGSPTRVVFDTLRGVDRPPLVYPGNPDSEYLLIEVGMPHDAEQIQLHLAEGGSMSLVLSSDSFVSFLLPRERLGDTPLPRIEYVSAGETHQRVLQGLNP